MKSERLALRTVREAEKAVEGLGSTNSELMALRAIHINVLVRNASPAHARSLKNAYNDVGAEAAISHEAYFDEAGGSTDLIAMGSVYHHREVQRILKDEPELRSLLELLAEVVENSPEVGE